MKIEAYIVATSPVDFLQGKVNSMALVEDAGLIPDHWVNLGKVKFNIADNYIESITEQALSVIDGTEKTLKAEFENKLTELKRQKNELLALELK